MVREVSIVELEKVPLGVFTSITAAEAFIYRDSIDSGNPIEAYTMICTALDHPEALWTAYFITGYDKKGCMKMVPEINRAKYNKGGEYDV